jgi:hypothetical protein
MHGAIIIFANKFLRFDLQFIKVCVKYKYLSGIANPIPKKRAIHIQGIDF